MRIPVVQNVSNDIKNFYPTSLRLAKAGKDGYTIARRTSSVYKQNIFGDLKSISKGVYKKVSKETTLQDLPVVAGALGLLVPLWLANPIFYLAGYIARELIMKYRDIKSKVV